MDNIYSQASYHKMPVGKKVIDNFLGSIWRVEEKTDKGVILRNVAHEDIVPGATMEVTPDTCRLIFREVA